MLLPGAVYILAFLVIVIALIACVLFGALIGIILHSVVPPLVSKTKGYARWQRGVPDADRWWFESNRWFHIGLYAGTILALYVLAGPIETVIKLLLGG